MIRGNMLLGAAFLAVLGSMGSVQAATIFQTLGSSAGFANGSTNARVGTWNTATAGNPAPFNGFNGSDPVGPNFSASWQFSFGTISNTILGASLQIGIYDIDSAATGLQVASFTEGSVDLTGLLNTVSEGLNGGTGAVNNEYDILTITLPGSTFADLAAGNPTFTLTLQGPGLGVLGPTSFNGAGIDFSTINITTQGVTPEPATWTMLLAGLAGIAGRKWLRRS